MSVKPRMKIKTLITIKKALEKIGEIKNMPKVLQNQMLLQPRGGYTCKEARPVYWPITFACSKIIYREINFENY